MQRKSWGGDDDVPRTCTHGRCNASHGVGMMTFLALAHMVDPNHKGLSDLFRNQVFAWAYRRHVGNVSPMMSLTEVW